ncbi:solute carrier family 2, facilitated glucose transporter member 6-like [Conger conger]|uniref:solute carrier family 2, facilitated glucose transporter member 6-like n=1 Tax=Conger conger TaxID=82655 RepID=UPI002A5A12E7|nr:solute carrier family 2, facilitated glucose transporter member 6-like [Conger conger]
MDETTPLVKNHPKTTRNTRLFLAVFSAVLGNFNFGYSMVYPSPVIPQLRVIDDPNLRMGTEQVAWFGSIFTLGAAAGGLGTMLLNDRVGRKLSIMLSAVPSTVGYLLMGAARAVWMLHLGRFLTGIAGGMTAASIPVYVSEISHPAVRGILGSCPQITAVCGSLALYALGLVLPWRWLAVAGEVPALIMLVLMCFMPRSPRFLIAQGNEADAHRALSWLRGPGSDVTAEFSRIQRSVASQKRITWAELGTPFYYKPILIAMVMRFLQQMTGITPILVYLEPIFQLTKVSLEAKYDAALVGAVRLLSIVIAASLMDKAGRKALLFTSGFLMFLSTLSMCMYTHASSFPTLNITSTPALHATPFDASSLIPLISTMVIIFGYAMGWGPITWLLMSEVLPLAARGVASGLCVAVSWLTAFVLVHVFMHVVEACGLFVPFLFFCVVCVINIIFTAVCVPETRGRSLEEIENFFRTGRTFTIRES